jgi:UPF0755 protein
MKKSLTAVALAIVVVVVAAFGSLFLPYRGFQGETFVKFDRGVGTPAMANELERAGVIRYSWQFLLARMAAPSVVLQAGEYRFNSASSVRTVLDRIAAGDVYYFDVTVPEGSNMFDIARLVDSQGVLSAEDFLKAAADPAPIRDLDPSAPNLEGYLFPSTYRLSHSTTAAELCKMMTAEFRRQWKKIGPAEVHRVVTLASLVEKETGVAAERKLVASVFENRLTKKMALDCDPTTIYAALLDHRYRGTIHRSDLDSGNPYNTYQNPGLPPGPIANPGAGAMDAAAHPAETDYLYFVAKPGGGGHTFSSTLEQHDKAVRAYRDGKRKSG